MFHIGLPKDKNKRLAAFRKGMRQPNGLLKPWVFFYLRFWCKASVISLDAYRQKKYADQNSIFSNPFKGKPWI